MLEHLSNCHGEWNFVFAAISSLPFIGIWVKSKMKKPKAESEKEC